MLNIFETFQKQYPSTGQAGRGGSSAAVGTSGRLQCDVTGAVPGSAGEKDSWREHHDDHWLRCSNRG